MIKASSERGYLMPNGIDLKEIFLPAYSAKHSLTRKFTATMTRILRYVSIADILEPFPLQDHVLTGKSRLII